MFTGWSATLLRLLAANLILPDKLFLVDPLRFESEALSSLMLPDPADCEDILNM